MNVQRTVSNIISRVRREGDSGLLRIIKKFDKVRLRSKDLRIPAKRIKGALNRLEVKKRQAIEDCGRRIQEFHWNEKKTYPSILDHESKGDTVGPNI